ncbi:hypothetical protein [Lysobacter sp. M2-1]|uniref:hypothetical protein n=1 Tax=Lysobacter sp. M2-1 TaxID=2916839 RepID=UPI001F56806B|nr:hypothetical protein [Lysobacter sp. M2-1]
MNPDQLPPLYRYIPVWTRRDDRLFLYRIVEIIGVGFVAQSCDYLSTDSDPEYIRQLERQFIELLFELPPEQRMQPQSSIQAAIADFDTQFQDGA